jgi:hypothetical protein
MKNTSILFLIAFFALTACNKKNQTLTYELGQNCLGGIVIQLDASKEHGLVAALSDQVTFAQHLDWGQSKAACEAYSVGGAGWRLPDVYSKSYYWWISIKRLLDLNFRRK